MKTLFVTDPLAGLAADIDASVGLMDACQTEGVEVWVCEPADLGVGGGRLLARARRIVLRPRHRGEDHQWQTEPRWYDEVERAALDVVASFEL
ncbi:MAG: glutathione synthase, partial [Nocardioidaceae bacterium]|nr:glutathione synthase [Nocardioidaceae bacterium]